MPVRLAAALLAASILAPTLTPGFSPQLAAQDRPSVLTSPSTEGRIARTIRQPATLYAYEAITIHARVTGYAKEVRVDLGDVVKTGELLVALEIPETEAALAAITAEVATAAAMIAKAEAQLALKHSLFKVTETLRATGGRTGVQLEQAAAELKLAEAELALARAGADEARARLKQTATLAAYAEVRAPFDGTVTERFVHPGALVRGGTDDPTALVEFQRTDQLRCRMEIPERDALLVLDSHRKGALHAELTLDALPAREFRFDANALKGSGIRLSGAVHPRSHHMLAEILVPNLEGELIPGLFGKLTLHAGASADAVTLVPNPAIQAPRRGATHVFVVGAATRRGEPGATIVEKRVVKLGVTNGSFVEVLEGLKPGEEVVVRGAGALLDGQKVKARSTAKSGADS